MADIYDVLNTIAGNLVTPIYPTGILNPSITGTQVTIEAGEPIRSELDLDLSSGFSHVSVYPTPYERVVTKFERNYESLTSTPPTITLTVSGNTVTVGGVVAVPQVVSLKVNGIGYAYPILVSDTLNTIATNTAALIPGGSALGNVITVIGAYKILQNVSTPYTASQEIARVDRGFKIECWCPTPAMRAVLSPAIDVYMKLNYRITLSDGYVAQVTYKSTTPDDDKQMSQSFGSYLVYIVQYPTTVTQTFTSIADPYLNSVSINYS